ncbi:MAG: hypothetical protein PHF18_16035 [Methanosarcina sp.]|uniref:hypothetical protein n=1 Tax=Methanosarcina sp. TaxID=2213 RepID=UPI00261E7D46|nr:hypothetical protein [Methanosarcina sp.]MDD3248339.1 hypothetical protein [Methanosarcina sp.]MDD4249199.1 hypothetical protein [Methanosarcina sp.]
MVKKAKKLSDEEIEEYKHENYQMMSALTGKSISELMGESPKRPNYDDNYCLVKQMYLKNCIEPISSRQLFEVLRKQGYEGKYSTFRGLLYYYNKKGYIQKLNNKKPFTYGLTDLGHQHAKNPYTVVDELAQRRMNFIYDKFRELINENPEKFKTIYESVIGSVGSDVYSVSGVSVGSVGTQYSNNDFGSEELKEELENKIYNPDFFKNADSDKLKLLADGLIDDRLTREEKEQMIIDALQEAVNSHKGSMVLNRESKSSKPDGERKYYKILVKSIGKPVTKSLYEKIPFVFIFVSSKNELRLESESIAGRYRNNKDAIFIDFDLVNQRYFYNNMQIKTKNNPEKKELEFYYTVVDKRGIWGFNRKITTMCFDDYQKAANKSGNQSVTINVQKND